MTGKARIVPSPVSLARMGPALTGIATVIIALVVMEVLVRAAIINPFLVPTPSQMILSLGRLFAEEDLAHRFWLTLGQALIACGLTTLVGIPIGALLHRYGLLRRAFEGWIAAWMAAPIVLAYPLFMVLIGRNSATIVTMAFLAGIGPVIIKALEGLSGVRASLVKVGQSFGLSERQLYWKVLLPAALPTIFTGIKLGAMRALLGVVGMEFLTNVGGLGQLINQLAERYDIPGMFASILFVVAVSVFFFTIVEWAEKWLGARS